MISEKAVLLEDNHLIAINKDAGVLVQGDKTGDSNLTSELGEYLKRKYDKPGDAFVGLIHRIDRPVSGLVLFAKTSKALTRMNEMFRTREVVKKYLAIVEGITDSDAGELSGYMIKDESKNKSFVSATEKSGYKKAELSYRVLQRLDRYSLLEITPGTGRHHQIRAQLSNMGHPIKGDLKYGAKRSNADGSICLHAWKLKFVHPVKKEEIEIVAPLPSSDIWTKLESI